MKEQASACVVAHTILALTPRAVIAAATGLYNTLDEVTTVPAAMAVFARRSEGMHLPPDYER